MTNGTATIPLNELDEYRALKGKLREAREELSLLEIKIFLEIRYDKYNGSFIRSWSYGDPRLKEELSKEVDLAVSQCNQNNGNLLAGERLDRIEIRDKYNKIPKWIRSIFN